MFVRLWPPVFRETLPSYLPPPRSSATLFSVFCRCFSSKVFFAWFVWCCLLFDFKLVISAFSLIIRPKRMGSGDCSDQVNSCQDVCSSSFEKLDSVSVGETLLESGDVPGMSVADKTNTLGPITPDTDRENGDFPVNLNSPPSSVEKRESADCVASEPERIGKNLLCSDHGSPQTPKDGVFDPFAPGPDDLALAPQCRKYVSKSRSVVARRLSFDCSIEVLEDKDCGKDALSVSDEEIVEAMYESLLETIVSSQTEVALAEISSLEWDSNKCMTPPSAPRLSGVVETCPGAPIRPAGKSRKIDLALCRRLQF